MVHAIQGNRWAPEGSGRTCKEKTKSEAQNSAADLTLEMKRMLALSPKVQEIIRAPITRVTTLEDLGEDG